MQTSDIGESGARGFNQVKHRGVCFELLHDFGVHVLAQMIRCTHTTTVRTEPERHIETQANNKQTTTHTSENAERSNGMLHEGLVSGVRLQRCEHTGDHITVRKLFDDTG